MGATKQQVNVNVHPFNTIADAPLSIQVSKEEPLFIDQLAMTALDADILAEAEVSGFNITFQISASCYSDVRSY